MDNDALSGLLNDPEALQNALRSVSSLLGASDAGGAPDAVSPADDPEAQLLPVITGIMQSGRAAVRPEKRALLSALRPFVAEDVASQFDRALRLAGMAGMGVGALESQPAAQLDDRQHRNEHGRKEFSLTRREQPLHDRVCHAPLPFLNDNAPII